MLDTAEEMVTFSEEDYRNFLLACLPCERYNPLSFNGVL